MRCSGFHIGRSPLANQAPTTESQPIHRTQQLPGSALRALVPGLEWPGMDRSLLWQWEAERMQQRSGAAQDGAAVSHRPPAFHECHFHAWQHSRVTYSAMASIISTKGIGI